MPSPLQRVQLQKGIIQDELRTLLEHLLTKRPALKPLKQLKMDLIINVTHILSTATLTGHQKLAWLLLALQVF